MNLTIHGRNLDIQPFVREYIEKKIGRLDRYLGTLEEAKVDLREEQTRDRGRQYVVQVTLFDQRGTILRGEEHNTEIFPAVDAVTDKMHRQITRFTGKRRHRYHRQTQDARWEEDHAADESDENELEEMIVRTKRFPMSPMSAEEAVEQMELLGHNFFVFYDVEEGTVNVVYRRRDGNYGLIIPELV